MAFVVEVLSEADKEFFKSLKIKSELSSQGRYVRVPHKWIVDKERDAYFILLEGDGSKWSEIPLFIALVWKGHIVRIKAFEESKGDNVNGYEVRWKIKKIVASTDLINFSSQISELITEALHVLGYAYKPCDVYIDELAAPVFREVVK